MVKLLFNPKDNNSSLNSKSTKKKVLNLNPFVSDSIDVNLVETKIELIGLENCHYTLKQWYFSEGKAGEGKANKKPLLIIGPTGCGKTSLIELFCKENDINLYSIKVLDSSKTKKDLLKEIYTFSDYSNSFFTKSISKKLILIDEYQNGQNDLLCITDIAELATKNIPPIVVISADSKGSKLSELKKVCEVYYIGDIHLGIIKSWTNSKFNDLDEETVFKFIKKCKNDIRLLSNNLLFLQNNKNIKCDEFIDSFYKDNDINIYDFTQLLFDNMELVDINDMFKTHETDGFLISNLVHENYLDYNENINNIADAAESISLGDLIYADTYESSKTFLQHSHCLNSMVIPSYFSRSDFKKNKCQFRTSCINNRYNIFLNNKKIFDKINLKITDVFIIKKFLNHGLVKTKIFNSNQEDYLRNIINTIGVDKLELIYKHFSEFNESLKEVKTKNFTLKFKEKIKAILNE